MGETSGVPGGATEGGESSERDEQAALTEYLGALVGRTEAAMRPRPAASARRRGRQRRLRRRVALGVAAAIVIVVSVLGVLTADLGEASRGGPATTDPLTPRQLPREVAPWKLTGTDRGYLGLLEYPAPMYCAQGRPPVGIRRAELFHYTSPTSLTASFFEIVIRLDDPAEAIHLVRELERRTADCPATSRTDEPGPPGGVVPGDSVSLWRRTEGETVTHIAIARRDGTVVVLLYTADARWQPQLSPTLAHAALVRPGDAR